MNISPHFPPRKPQPPTCRSGPVQWKFPLGWKLLLPAAVVGRDTCTNTRAHTFPERTQANKYEKRIRSAFLFLSGKRKRSSAERKNQNRTKHRPAQICLSSGTGATHHHRLRPLPHVWPDNRLGRKEFSLPPSLCLCWCDDVGANPYLVGFRSPHFRQCCKARVCWGFCSRTICAFLLAFAVVLRRSKVTVDEREQ